MDNCILLNIVIHFAAQPTALAHSFTRNLSAELAGVKPQQKKAPNGIPVILLQSTQILSQKLPEEDKTSPTCPQKRVFSKEMI